MDKKFVFSEELGIDFDKIDIKSLEKILDNRLCCDDIKNFQKSIFKSIV